ncbi:MAG: lactate utilization protein C [Bacillota bacterium]|nr:lactate utilization protein C [Bacillota bacterium]
MTSVNDFISQLAQKLGRSTPTETPEPVPIHVPQYRLSDPGERAAIFLHNWQALGGKGTIVKSTDEVIQCLKEWFEDLELNWLNKKSIVAWDMLPRLAESSFETLNWPLVRYPQAALDPRERHAIAAQAELGVTGADWGIALSGTVVINSNSERGRAVSLLPPRHLAFIEATKIKDNLGEVLQEVSASGNPPSAIELITGPSRTSDIEMDLSIGVHGPIEVYVIIIED